jgi:hypothetical protein
MATLLEENPHMNPTLRQQMRQVMRDFVNEKIRTPDVEHFESFVNEMEEDLFTVADEFLVNHGLEALNMGGVPAGDYEEPDDGSGGGKRTRGSGFLKKHGKNFTSRYMQSLKF